MSFLFVLLLMFSPDMDLIRAKYLTFHGRYEESDKILNTINNKIILKDNNYHLCKMVNAYQQNNKAIAEKHLRILEDSFEPLPRRYEAIIILTRAEIDHWSYEGLDDIGRDMKHSANRLSFLKGGKKTQDIQLEIIRKLDKKIKDMEDKANVASGDKQENGNVKSKPQPQKPLEDIVIVNERGEGKINEKKLKVIADSWGTMPPKERLKVINDLTRGYPARYRVIIEDYFRALSNVEKP